MVTCHTLRAPVSSPLVLVIQTPADPCYLAKMGHTVPAFFLLCHVAYDLADHLMISSLRA